MARIVRRQRLRGHEAVLVRQDDRSVWRPDAVVTVQFNPNYQISDHPIETGATVSDHVQRLPLSAVLTAIVTENPVRRGTVVGGRIHLQEELDWLYETADGGRLVNIVTRRLGVFRGFAIQSLPHRLDNVARLEFQVSLREIRIATANTVLISVENVTPPDYDFGPPDFPTQFGAPDEIDVGEQPTTDTSSEGESEPAEEEDQSALAALIG